MTDRGIWVFSDSGKTRETTPEKHAVHFHELLLKYFRVLKDYYKLFVNLSITLLLKSDQNSASHFLFLVTNTLPTPVFV